MTSGEEGGLGESFLAVAVCAGGWLASQSVCHRNEEGALLRVANPELVRCLLGRDAAGGRLWRVLDGTELILREDAGAHEDFAKGDVERVGEQAQYAGVVDAFAP